MARTTAEAAALISHTQPAPVASTHRKGLLMGYYGMGNLGDEMMLVCLKSWLEKQGFAVTVLSEHPDAVTHSSSVEAS